MKKIIAAALAAMLIALSFSGCVVVNYHPVRNAIAGKGTPESYEFKVGDINELRVELLCNVRYYSSPSDTVTLEIQPNLIDYITVDERAGVLTLRATRNIVWNNYAPVLTVYAPDLNRLSIAGAGNFRAYDTIETDSFELRLDGAGSGTAEFDVNKLRVDMAGAGDFILSGRADSVELNMAGAGRLDALSLEARMADIVLAGVGAVRVNCSERLRIEAGGLGSVEYKGSPEMEIDRGGLVSISKYQYD